MSWNGYQNAVKMASNQVVVSQACLNEYGYEVIGIKMGDDLLVKMFR